MCDIGLVKLSLQTVMGGIEQINMLRLRVLIHILLSYIICEVEC